MTRLVVVVPLEEGAREEARRLVEQGPPLDLEKTRFDHHQVFLTRNEAVFVFEAPDDEAATLDVPAEDPGLWRAAARWQRLMADRPRTAETVFTWDRDA